MVNSIADPALTSLPPDTSPSITWIDPSNLPPAETLGSPLAWLVFYALLLIVPYTHLSYSNGDDEERQQIRDRFFEWLWISVFGLLVTGLLTEPELCGFFLLVITVVGRIIVHFWEPLSRLGRWIHSHAFEFI